MFYIIKVLKGEDAKTQVDEYSRPITQEIYSQIVSEIDLKAIINAVNGGLA